MLMLPAFTADPRFRLVACAAPREESRAAFVARFGGRAHADVAALCADPEVEAVYVATPHQMHAEHVVAAARAGKHILVDKPLSVSMADGARMVDTARSCGVTLIVGPSHSFDAPVLQARDMIAGGQHGALRMVQALNYTDFLYRPRRPEELRTRDGGGVMFSQAIHQIDVVRLLAGGRATRVAAMTGAWDPDRPTEGAFSALIGFEGGAFATLTYSGYAHFDSDVWMDNVSELGHDKPPGSYGAARRALAGLSPDGEMAAKTSRTFGAGSAPPQPAHHEHFGPVLALCDRADLRLTPKGVEICADTRRYLAPAAGTPPRAGVLDAVVDALRNNRPPVQTGAWGLASLEICHAILTAARTGAFVDLAHQVAAPQQEI